MSWTYAVIISNIDNTMQIVVNFLGFLSFMRGYSIHF
jgi:hypothetical protein